MLIVPAILLIVGGGYYWLTSGGSVSTDDAQVKQDIVSVSAQVNGPITQVFVRNGSQVKRGDLLFRIDPAPYQVALEQAQAQLAAAQLQTSAAANDQAAGTGADIVGAQANLAIKRNALGRQQALLKQGFTTRADYEDALNEVQTRRNRTSPTRAPAQRMHTRRSRPASSRRSRRRRRRSTRPSSTCRAPKSARRWTAWSRMPTTCRSARWP